MVRITDDRTAIKVREAGYPDEKTYIVRRIMHIKTQCGQTATNHATVSKYNDYVRSKQERKRLIDICEFGSISKLHDHRFEVTRENRVLWILNKENYIQAYIEANNVECARRAAFGIELMLSESRGFWWDIQQIMVSGCVFWPNWMELQAKLYKEGQRIAQSFETQNPGLKLAEQTAGIRSDAYARSPLWSASEGLYLDWLRIFETPPFNMKDTLYLVARTGLSRDEYKEYILGSNGDQVPIPLPDRYISDSTLATLLKKDLARPAPLPTLATALSRKPLAELQPLARELGIKYSKYKKAELASLLSESMPPDLVDRIMSSLPECKSYVLQPPNGLTWKQFQDFKSCYRQMFAMLVDFLDEDSPSLDTPMGRILL